MEGEEPFDENGIARGLSSGSGASYLSIPPKGKAITKEDSPSLVSDSKGFDSVRLSSGSGSSNFSSPPKGEAISEEFFIPAVRSSRLGERSRSTTLYERPESSEELDFTKIKPAMRRSGERTVSTSLRLRRQGFRASRSNNTGFAVKSIRRGSDDWLGLIKPFVSDLAFRSLEYRRFQSEVSFRPYTCEAAVLFVDLSGYSKITAAISHRGAHALSNIVNDYLSRLLDIVRACGGDVVKFAGDAVLVVWEGPKEDIGINFITAAKCVMEMQEEAGEHPIEGTSLSFRIHCGLTCGHLDSEIFAAPNHENMQRLYHSVGGESLVEISELVDIAKAGEVCISKASTNHLGSRATYREVPGRDDCLILEKLNLDESILEMIDMHVMQIMSDRMMMRNTKIEEEFIHPSVLRLLSHGGLTPTQIAQMRNLCVLFIAMTSHGSSVNWLMEVQAILDKNRCPIVQIIDDDKGVHIVAAVNLYESVPETSLLGISVCRELVNQQVGCAIGMALGSTFCGVTGCSSVACRWDITGPPPVRAARLMQYALLEDIEVAIDQSVYDDPMAATYLTVLNSSVGLKGAEKPVPVYTFSDASNSAASRVLETVHGRVYDDIVEQIENHINSCKHRCAVVVTGIPLAGKKIICQRAAGNSDLVPYLHRSDTSAGFLQLARTIATWFRYINNDDIQYLVACIFDHLAQNHWSRAHDCCIQLVDIAISEGLRACFLVDRIQFLDDFSLSLIRECLHGISNLRRSGSSIHASSHFPRRDVDRSVHSPNGNGKLKSKGMICFLCVHVSLYNYKSAENVVEDITRAHRHFSVPIVKVHEAKKEELRTLISDLADMKVDELWLEAHAEASGYCAGYFIERTAAIRTLSGKLWSEGKRGLHDTTKDLCIAIPPGHVRAVKQLPVTQISAEVAMRFYQIFDDLPPLFQTFCKALAISTRTGFYKLPRVVMWEVLNDLIAEGVEAGVLSIMLDELKGMCLLKVEHENEEDVLSFQSPALGDIAFEVSTPIQIRTVASALIDRLHVLLEQNFMVPFVIANLHHQLDQEENKKKLLWVLGYKLFLEESRGWPQSKVLKWKDTIKDEIAYSGCNAADICGDDFYVLTETRPVVTTKKLPLIKMYQAPISFGPMGHTLSVVTRNIFHEFGAFHGYREEVTNQVRASMQSASQRYLREMATVEKALSDHGCGTTPEELERERTLLGDICTPAASDDDVEQKAERMLDTFIPRHVEDRLQRLYALVKKLRKGGIPGVIQRGDCALRHSYEALCDPAKCYQDAAQDALMILATKNWKPKPVPEYLPILYYQTVARLRNKVLKRLSEGELLIFKHQHTERDLEAFLFVTALLYEAEEKTEQRSLD